MSLVEAIDGFYIYVEDISLVLSYGLQLEISVVAVVPDILRMLVSVVSKVVVKLSFKHALKRRTENFLDLVLCVNCHLGVEFLDQLPVKFHAFV